MASEVSFDPIHGSSVIINATEVATLDIADAFEREAQPLVAQLVRWSQETKLPASRRGTLFDRDRFLAPVGTFDQIRVGRDAMTDDVVGTVADSTESLVFSEVDFFHVDDAQQDAWNQWAARLELDAYLRAVWRQLMSDSQVVTAMWWGRETYRFRGKGEKGAPSRKEFTFTAPMALSILDTLKVTPVGSLMFGQERLAYIATRDEADAFDEALNLRTNPARWLAEPAPPGRDEIVERLILRRYEAGPAEQRLLRDDGVDPEYLYELDPNVVWRHTLTRPHYQRFASVRMIDVAAWLDMKHQLFQMDRAQLIGGTNYIILVKKGTDKLPAEQEEVEALAAGMHVLARLPVIVGDHRLSVEIVTPKLDTTLDSKRYTGIDSRIASRLYQTFGEGGNPLEMGKIIAEGLESRRKMIRRSFENKVIAPVVARNPELTKPKMRFTPKHISLAFDQAWASYILEQRQTKELSRDTSLGEFGFDQAEEAQLREREERLYDDTFKTQVPFSAPGEEAAPAPGKNRSAGRSGGGTRNGGGAAPGSGQGKSARRPRRTSDGDKP